MFEVFGNFDTADELNACAKGLMEEGDMEEQIPGQMEVKDYPELMPKNVPDMNPPVHEITEDVIQEGEMVRDILKSGDADRIMKLLKGEFKEPECGWENWEKKVVNLDEH